MHDSTTRPLISVPVSEVQAWVPRAAAVIDRLTQENDHLHQENAQLRAALEPFARNADAVSLAQALGHIERDHLLAARRALRGPLP